MAVPLRSSPGAVGVGRRWDLNLSLCLQNLCSFMLVPSTSSRVAEIRGVDAETLIKISLKESPEEKSIQGALR